MIGRRAEAGGTAGGSALANQDCGNQFALESQRFQDRAYFSLRSPRPLP